MDFSICMSFGSGNCVSHQLERWEEKQPFAPEFAAGLLRYFDQSNHFEENDHPTNRKRQIKAGQDCE